MRKELIVKDDNQNDIEISVLGEFKVDSLEKEYIMYSIISSDENIKDGRVLIGEVNRDENVLKERFKKYFPVFTESEKIIEEMEKRKIIKEKKLNENIDNILEKINETKKLIEIAEHDKHIPINLNNNDNNN